MTLEICPSCGVQDSIFLARNSGAVKLDGTLSGSRVEAFCNNVSCEQRYWYFPQSGRVTRRNTGGTYQEWRLQRFDLGSMNAARQSVGLSPLVESPVPPPSKYKPIRVEPEEFIRGSPYGFAAPRSTLRQYLYERWCWVRAFFVVYVPGFRRFSVCKEGDDD